VLPTVKNRLRTHRVGYPTGIGYPYPNCHPYASPFFKRKKRRKCELIKKHAFMLPIQRNLARDGFMARACSLSRPKGGPVKTRDKVSELVYLRPNQNIPLRSVCLSLSTASNEGQRARLSNPSSKVMDPLQNPRPSWPCSCSLIMSTNAPYDCRTLAFTSNSGMEPSSR
jgi:hypothetical protein